MTKTIKTSLLTLLSVILAVVCVGAFATMPKTTYADTKPAKFADAMDTYFEDNGTFLTDDQIAADYSALVEKYNVTKALYNDAVGAGTAINDNDATNYAHLEALFDDALRLRTYMQSTLNQLVASKSITTALETDGAYLTHTTTYASLLADGTVVGSTTLGALATAYFEEYASIQNQVYGMNNFEVVAEVLSDINDNIDAINTAVTAAVADVEAGIVKLSDAATIDAAEDALLGIYDVYATAKTLTSLDQIAAADLAKVTDYVEYKGYYDQLVAMRAKIDTLNDEIKDLSNFYVGGDTANVCYTLKFDDAERTAAPKGAVALRSEFNALPDASDDNQAAQITNIGLLEALETAIATVQGEIDAVVAIIVQIDADLYTEANKDFIDDALADFDALPDDVTANDEAVYAANGTAYYVTNGAGDDYAYLKAAEAKYAEMKAEVEAFIAALDNLIVIEENMGDVRTAVKAAEEAILDLTAEQISAYAGTALATAYDPAETDYGTAALATYGEVYDYFAYYEYRIPSHVDPVEDAIKTLIAAYEANDPDGVAIGSLFTAKFKAAEALVDGIAPTIYNQYVSNTLLTYYEKIDKEYYEAFADVEAWVETVKALYVADTTVDPVDFYAELKKLSIATDSAELVKLTTIDAVKANYENNLSAFHVVIEDSASGYSEYYAAYVAMEAAVTARAALDTALANIATEMNAISVLQNDIAATDTTALEDYNDVIVGIDADLDAYADDIINFYFMVEGATHKAAYNNFVAAIALNEVYKVEVLINKVEAYPGVSPITFDTYRASIATAEAARVALNNDAAIRNLADLDADKADLANYEVELDAWIDAVKAIAADVDAAKALERVNLVTLAGLNETLAGFATLTTWNGATLSADATIKDSALLTEAKAILAQIETTAWKLINDLTDRIDDVVAADLNADADEIAAINAAYEKLDATQIDVANDNADDDIADLVAAKAALVALETKIGKLSYFISAVADLNADVVEGENYTVENAIMYNVLYTIYTNYETSYQTYLENNGHKALLDAVATALDGKALLNLTAVNEDLAAAIEDIEDLQGDLADVAGDLSDLIDELEIAFADVDNDLADIQAQINGVNFTIEFLTAYLEQFAFDYAEDIEDIVASIVKEAEDRDAADAILDAAIDAVVADLAQAKIDIKAAYEAAIAEAVANLEAADAALKAGYEAADAALKAAYEAADAALTAALTKEVSDREAADKALDEAIKAVKAALDKEIADREAADKALEEKLMAEIKSLNTKLVVASVILAVFTAALIGAVVYIFLKMFKKEN